MTIVVLTDCPPRLRGDLTKWLLEINTGVYVGRVNARVRDELWERICDNVKHGRATMVFNADNEQRMDFRVHNTTWQPIDFDGLKLMRRPNATETTASAVLLPDGFSKAAHQQKARRVQAAAMRSKPVEQCYVVVDVETTGLNPATDQMIELAALRVVNGTPTAEFQRYVRIDGNVPTEIEALTGISDAMLRERGVPLAEALGEFLAFLADDLLVSHHAVFDQRFVLAACKACKLPPMSNRMCDTLTLARKKVRGCRSYKLTALAERFGIPVQTKHQAMADCYITHELYGKLNEL